MQNRKTKNMYTKMQCRVRERGQSLVSLPQAHPDGGGSKSLRREGWRMTGNQSRTSPRGPDLKPHTIEGRNELQVCSHQEH